MRPTRRMRWKAITGFAASVVTIAASLAAAPPSAGVASGTIESVVGGPGSGPALDVAQHPIAVAASGGTVYVLDVPTGIPPIGVTYSGTIRAIDVAAGTERLVAGDGRAVGGYRGDGGSALAARFSQPFDVGADASGNVYVSDSANNRIRKISPSGIITTIAGPAVGFSGDGGPASSAAINLPTSMTVDPAGNVYFFDSYNRRIRRIDTAGTITTVVGNGSTGSGGDGGAATAAQLTDVRRMAIDAQGSLYLPDLAEGRVRKVANGVITTMAQVSTFAVAPGPQAGTLYASFGSAVVQIDANGTTTYAGSTSESGYVDGARLSARFDGIRSLATTSDGAVYVGDLGNRRVRRVAGTVTTIAGNGTTAFGGDGREAVNAQIDRPGAIATAPDGSFVFVDRGNNRIRRVSPAGIITTIAGNGEEGFSGDGGPATSATFLYPTDVAFAPDGAVLIADAGNNRVRRVDVNGVISTIAGNGSAQSTGDGGPAIGAGVREPVYIEVTPDGDIFIGEWGGIRAVDDAGTIHNVMTAGGDDWSDGATLPTAHVFPRAFVVRDDGLYFVHSEQYAMRIKRLDPCGQVSTLAGGGISEGDGPARNSYLFGATALAADAAGNLFFTETGPYSDNQPRHERVRRISPDGTLTTLAGGLAADYAGDGGPATAARFDVPNGVAIRANGDVIVSDWANGRIRAVGGASSSAAASRPCWSPPPPPPPTTTTTPTTPSPPAPPPPPPPAVPRSGYWMLDHGGHVYAFGDAAWMGGAATADAVDIEATPSGQGYWILDAAGNVYSFGDARYLGGTRGLLPGETATSLSKTPTGNGYWIFTSRGRVRAFGDAPFLGDMAGVRLNGPVLDSVPTPSGAGYYMVASDGGVFTFGDAHFRGSMGAARLNAPVQSLVPDVDNSGYWLVASDGGIFTFDAAFHGSMGAVRLNRPVTGMVASTTGLGYLMVGEDGGIFTFGDVVFRGSLGAAPPAEAITSVAAVPA